MQVTAAYFRGSTVLAVPDGDVSEKHAISTSSKYDYEWEMEYVPTLRMLAVSCLRGDKRAVTHVPLENVASMTLVTGSTVVGAPKK